MEHTSTATAEECSRRAATPCGHTCGSIFFLRLIRAAPTHLHQEPIKIPPPPRSCLSIARENQQPLVRNKVKNEQPLPFRLVRLLAVVPADEQRLQAGHERVGDSEREDVLPVGQLRLQLRPVRVRRGQRKCPHRPGESHHAEPKRPAGILPGEGALPGVRQRQAGAADPGVVPETDPHPHGLQQVRGHRQSAAPKGDPAYQGDRNKGFFWVYNYFKCYFWA